MGLYVNKMARELAEYAIEFKDAPTFLITLELIQHGDKAQIQSDLAEKALKCIPFRDDVTLNSVKKYVQSKDSDEI